MRGLRRLWCDEGAATAVEYAIIVAAVAGLVVVVAFALGRKARNLINNTTSAMP
jgi:Flp pilus assembly pilin Flp